MNIVFLGSGAFGLPTLGWLAGAHTITGIVTQPDRPAGRARALTPTPIGAWGAHEAPHIPILKPEDASEPSVRDAIRAWPADAWVIIAFGQKLSPALIADRFAINLHASLLPRWRGAAPINHAVLAGDAETGNSVITIANRMDAGLILHQARRAIDPLWVAGEVHDVLAQDGPSAIDAVLRGHAAGTLAPRTQDESGVTRATKLSRADDTIDFSRSARECRCRIHGLTPWPGITVALDDHPMKVLRVQDLPRASESEGAAPGIVIDPGAGIVACGAGSALRILEVQPPGKRAMNWLEYSRGRSISAGAMVRSAGNAGRPDPC